MIQRLTIQGKLPGLNEYTRANRTNPQVGAKMKREANEVCLWEARAARLKPMRPPVMVRIAWFEPNRRRDPDNVVSGKKFILDALVEAGVIGNDNWQWVAGFEEKVALDRENPRIEVELEETECTGR